MANVFAYGTLMFPEVASRVASIETWGEPVVLEGFQRYRVNLPRERGHFPAIVRESGAVTGLLFRDIDERQLARLDAFEEVAEGSYTRELESLETAAGRCEAYAYVCGEPLRPGLSGPWNPLAFRSSDLSWYLENIVEPFARELAERD